MRRDAVFSPCGRYRFALTRVWNEDAGRACFVMLNPSKASAARDDNTIVRCIRFAVSWGYGSIEVGNLWPLVATDPRALRAWLAESDRLHRTYAPRAEYDAVMLDNRAALRDMVARARRVVAAWGADPAARAELPGQGMAGWLATHADVWCLGTTASGAPKHPLRLASATALTLYAPRTGVPA